ncbi:velvet factor-domain-containing protein [Coniochaeta sp. 2T2.1]|nr:velvet factor-domain-containing protein [Coniochaeta sp. 2T2.1]
MAQHVAPAPAPHPAPAHNELQSTLLERVTKSGRRLWYKLAVIQQPERARACGSGPKSSADRRPVDPPPVVELRIFEGNTWEEAEHKDITFLYNANFFLYVTLEHARVIAHGRVQTPAANQPPILTGMPVSGMAYLDRPNEAGYFLFPDLSVRHEGRYRLTFNLYEETKEDKDKDPDTPDSNIITPGFANATGGSFDFRMEVKSLDFVVFSAKKFPGLAESTALSRVVAEQGCRVRIRRDVRMRRRDGGKAGGGDYDNNVESEYTRRKRTETPEVKPNYRPRSMSGSVERSSFSAESQRRTSGAEYPPQFPQTPASAGGHLQFLSNSAQYHPHAQSQSKPPSMPPSPSYQTSHGAQFPPVHQPPQKSIPPQSPHVQSPAYQGSYSMHQAAYPPPAQQQTYGQPDRPQPQPYAQSNPSPQQETAPREFREPPPPSHQYREPAQRDFRDASAPSQMYRQPQNDYMFPKPGGLAKLELPSSRSSGLTLPPIQSIRDLTGATSARMPPQTSPTADRIPQLQPMGPPKYTAPQLPPLPAPPSVAGSKRSRDDSGRYDIDAQRYHNGAREDPRLAEEEVDPPMYYKRANGAWMSAPTPSGPA